MSNQKQSALAYERACKLFPGGVNSPVRAFKGVGGTPIFFERGEGPYLFDVDGNKYVDYVQSWGPSILGHAHPAVVDAVQKTAAKGLTFGACTPLESDLAELIQSFVPSMELMRFNSSGTEATMSALRVARAFTGRSKIIKFAGCYHGHSDSLLVQAGSGVATLGLPDSPGVPASATSETIVVPFNRPEVLEDTFKKFSDSIACVITEPIIGNMGFIRPKDGFLQHIQNLCHRYGALFVMDEVMTGFRVALGGAQQVFGLKPDLTCLAKVIGGGMPVAAYGGRKDVMCTVAPLGPMYQAGTLSGNPVAMAAGIATLKALSEPGVFEGAAKKASALVADVRASASRHGLMVQADCEGTMFGMGFANGPVDDDVSAKANVDKVRYGRFFHAMLNRGFYFAPSAFEAAFMSAAHSADDVGLTAKAIDGVFCELANDSSNVCGMR